jgi:hypothetical protein
MATLIFASRTAVPFVNRIDIKVVLISMHLATVSLLHVLAVHGRMLMNWSVWHTLQQVAGIQSHPRAPLALKPYEKEVPLLLRDPTALLIQFILLLPLHLDQSKSLTWLLKYKHHVSLWHCTGLSKKMDSI